MQRARVCPMQTRVFHVSPPMNTYQCSKCSSGAPENAISWHINCVLCAGTMQTRTMPQLSGFVGDLYHCLFVCIVMDCVRTCDSTIPEKYSNQCVCNCRVQQLSIVGGQCLPPPFASINRYIRTNTQSYGDVAYA